MNLFDLLFIALFLTAVGTLLSAAGLAVVGRFGRAGRILRRLLLCASVYMAVVIAVSLFSRRRMLDPTAQQCFDDWCIGVAGVRRTEAGDAVKYSVNLRLSSRARRVAQRERNLAVYLTDDRGRRYDAVGDYSNAPFSVLLQPGESALVNRTFVVPASLKGVALVVRHEGGFPIGWFIIGYDAWFRKPPLVQLQ